MKISPVFKQGFFASQTRLLYTTNKASLQCKEALFENGGNNPNRSLDLGLIRNNILTACAIPSYQNSSTIVWRGYSFTLRFIITLLPVVTSTAFSALPIISA